MEQTAESNIDTSNITDEQVDKYFESGGEVDIGSNEQQASEQETNDAAAPQASEEQQQEQEEKKTRYVDYNALHEERMKRKELQSVVDNLKQKNDQMEQRWNFIAQKMQQEGQPKPPTFDEDPLEHLRHQQEQQAKYLQQQHEVEQQRQQSNEIERRKQQFVNHYRSQAHEFAKAQPEFVEAYQYLSESRINEYLAAGYDAEQATQLLHEDEMAIASKAFQDGVNPGERLMALAKTRGYKPSTQKQQAEQKVQQINKGVQISKSLNNAGGKVSNDVTMESLASMPMDEFEEYVSKNWNKIAKMMS